MNDKLMAALKAKAKSDYDTMSGALVGSGLGSMTGWRQADVAEVGGSWHDARFFVAHRDGAEGNLVGIASLHYGREVGLPEVRLYGHGLVDFADVVEFVITEPLADLDNPLVASVTDGYRRTLKSGASVRIEASCKECGTPKRVDEDGKFMGACYNSKCPTVIKRAKGTKAKAKVATVASPTAPNPRIAEIRAELATYAELAEFGDFSEEVAALNAELEELTAE